MSKKSDGYTLYLSSRTFLVHLGWAGVGLIITAAALVLIFPASLVAEITIIPVSGCLVCMIAGSLLFLVNAVLFVLRFIYWVTHRLEVTEKTITFYTFRGKRVFARSELKSARMRQESGGDIRHNRGVLSFRSETAAQDFGLVDDELRIIAIFRRYVRDPAFPAVAELQRGRA